MEVDEFKKEMNDFTKEVIQRQNSTELKIDQILKRMCQWQAVNECYEHIQKNNISIDHLKYSLLKFDNMRRSFEITCEIMNDFIKNYKKKKTKKKVVRKRPIKKGKRK